MGAGGPGSNPSWGARIAHWYCVGLAVLLDAASWVRSSSGENFYAKGSFLLELTWALTPSPPNFLMTVQTKV